MAARGHAAFKHTKMELKVIKSIFDQQLEPGFLRRGGSWFKSCPEILQVVSLQKSRFGNSFYVNIAFVPSGMPVKGMPWPKEVDCPVRIRLETIFPDDSERIKEVFNLEAQIADLERRDAIVGIICERINKLSKCSQDISSFKKMLQSDAFINAAITSSARDFLDLK